MFKFNQIPANIQRKLFKRMNALTREENYAPLNPMSEQKVNALSEMLTKSCWVKVTAALPQYKEDKDGKFIRKLEKTGHEPFHLSSGFVEEKGTRYPKNRPITSKANLMNNNPTYQML